MKKLMILAILTAVLIPTLMADNVAVLTFEKKDRASDYVAKQMLSRDFGDIFEDYENYDLVNKKDVKKAVDKSGYSNMFYLGKEDIASLGTTLEADILIWGTVTSITNSEFKVAAKILSMKSLDVIAVNFNVKKDSKQRKEAIKENLITRMEEFSAGEVEKLIGIAMQHFNSENYASAQESFLSVLEMESANIEATFYLGLISFINSDYVAAESYYLQALELDPDNNDIKNYLSKVYLEQDMSDEAISLLTEIAEDTQDKLVWMRIGKIYAEMEYYDEAQASFEKAIELDAEYGNAYLEIGYLLYDQEYYEDAIPYMEEAAKVFPEDDDIQKKLAACYKKTGKLDNAIQQYKDIIAEQPDNIRAYMNLANAYTATEQYNEAISIAGILKEKIPEDPKVYILFASSYSSLKQFNKAENNAMRALELDSELYQPFRILSDIYFSKGYNNYEEYLVLEEKAKDAYGTEADELVEQRDNTKLNAHNDFSKAKHYLEEVPKLTENSSELKYVRSRMDTIDQLLEATQKDFF
ncbi:tetratricopeptide repeat protein [Candidatus Cloacimonadota bacterium]